MTQSNQLRFDLAANLAAHYPNLLEKGLQFIPAGSLSGKHFPAFSTAIPALILFESRDKELKEISPLLLAAYAADTEVMIIDRSEGEIMWRGFSLGELPNFQSPVEAIFLPATVAPKTLEEFMEIIAHLRAPDGCPWDRKQTHASLRPYLLEETYEALEALDREDMAGLQEELGDLLLQITLHAQIAAEKGEFTIGDVLAGINRKIVSRHPHVFGEVVVENAQQVVQNWEKLKEIERVENGKSEKGGLLEGIPAILPALSQAQSIQDRAARVGFDWPEISPVLDKVHEELEEVRTAEGELERAKELGDLLFAVVNLVRWHKVDAESALRQTNLKFRKRFSYLEQQAKSTGRELQKMTLAEMDALWEEAKQFDD